MSIYFFIAASGFFLAINFQFFVWDVIWYLRSDKLPSDMSEGTQTTQEVLRFVFVQGFFFALILCYWRFQEPELNIQETEEAEIGHGIIDRTGIKPREVEGSEPTTGATEKGKIIHEANDLNEILEADSSNAIPDQKGVLEADSANGILEADSKSLHEKG